MGKQFNDNTPSHFRVTSGICRLSQVSGVARRARVTRRVTMVARTSRRAVAAREESSTPREETFAAAIATPLDAGTSDGEILLNARDSPSEGVDVDERERGDVHGSR